MGKELPNGVLQRASKINPHGLGVVWLDSYEIDYLNSNDYRTLESGRPYIAHFRYATVGAISMANVHPFVCGKNRDEYLMMNGTIPTYGDKFITDTEALARQLGNMSRATWKKVLSEYYCRFVSINVAKKSYEIYNKELWTRHDGVWYSKENVLQQNKVAVYGTLKKGNGNYYHYLNDSEFVGHGVTKDKYPLIVQSLPYLLDIKGDGTNVSVDVFNVSDSVLYDLDKLEGHPQWYKRKQIPILVNGSEVMCWVYFNPSMMKGYTGYGWVKSYEQRPLTRYTYRDVKPKAKRYADSESVCINCYNQLEYDGYSSYHCTACGEWFTEEEALFLNHKF